MAVNNMHARTIKLLITFSVLTLLGIVVFVVMIKIIQKKVEAINVFNAQIKEEATYADSNRSMKLLLNDINPDISKLNSRIIPANGTVAFVEKIENLARANGLTVQINSLNATPDPKQKNTFQWLKINLATQGSWQSTYRFLSLLQTLPYKADIDTVVLNEALVPTGSSKNQPQSKSVWGAVFSFSVLQQK